jgi:NADP-dependent 3-hydroxy acid dehydrogenase YdfG
MPTSILVLGALRKVVGSELRFSRPDQLEVLAAKYGDQMLPLALYVTDNDAALEAVRSRHERFGRIDVVVYNAESGDISALEDVTV